MRLIVAPFLVCVAIGTVPAPASGQVPSSTDSTPNPAPPAPDPARQRYLQGLRTAGRGVAQIKTGIDRLNRARSTRDSSQVKLATKRLTGYCTAARGFIASGRGQMNPVAYDLPTRKQARDLTVQLDSLTLSVKECQNARGLAPEPLNAGLVTRLKAYDAALAEFRTAIGLPNRQ